ncbi:uncharacterized protein LOC122528422 isoform X2 [Frieseomelitta varia]|uniref:uncharacterized protein LOC122528422 isoform X2 n=1 Tax=Frieseomelitta varia TaxID=561572 RepID=UPI001CB67939|nr:uncharacterized protein LOC122528422 isoform X2 [Frieseomelitta varia]
MSEKGNSIGPRFQRMSRDNRNVSSIGKTPSSLTDKRSCPTKSRQKLFMSKMSANDKKKGKWTSNSTAKYQHAISIPVQDETIKVKAVESKGYTDSIGNRSYKDTIDDDPITVLRKEIQDWRNYELSTSRIEEKLTGTSSEERSYNYIASGDTTKRQPSSINVSKASAMRVNLPATTHRIRWQGSQASE